MAISFAVSDIETTRILAVFYRLGIDPRKQGSNFLQAAGQATRLPSVYRIVGPLELVANCHMASSPLFSVEADTLQAEEDNVWAEITGSISPQHRKRSIDDLTIDSFASLVSSPSSSVGSEQQVCREVSTTTDDSSLLIETNINKRQAKDNAQVTRPRFICNSCL